jgi:futalosine hydrolase
MKIYASGEGIDRDYNLAILHAVPAEGELLLRALQNKLALTPNITAGTLFGKRVVLAETSIGKTNAAMAATFAIWAFKPSIIVSTGICGAYPGMGLDIGDVAIAREEIYADEGLLLHDGFHTMEAIGIPLVRHEDTVYYNAFPLDDTLTNKAIDTLGNGLGSHCSFKAGTFLTLSAATGTDSRAAELVKTFNPLGENMEGAAVAHVATAYGIRAFEIRGVSNLAGNRDMSRWDIKNAARNCQEALLRLIESPNFL